MHRECQWGEVVDTMITQHLIRFVQGSGVLARSWLSAIPTEKSLRWSNDQVCYGLRLGLLSKFRDVRAPSNICPDCPGNVADDPCHHRAAGHVGSSSGVDSGIGIGTGMGMQEGL